MTMYDLAIIGTYITPLTNQTWEILENKVICVKNGTITDIRDNNAIVKAKETIMLGKFQFVTPGFIDTHIHAPQFEYAGKALDKPLMGTEHEPGWLTDYAFPTEASFASVDIARNVYDKVVCVLLKNGTTCANYFSTCHPRSAQILAATADKRGQRAVVGKVSMDQNAPENMLTTATDDETELFQVLNFIQSSCSERIMPSLIPRFTPTCSSRALSLLGEIARERRVRVHTHLSESRGEVAFASATHPDFPNDTELFQATGLLTPLSIFAHSVYLSGKNLSALAEAGASIAHCPLSNFYFADDCFQLVRALDRGIRVGLGTDVAGGYSPSMFDAMRHAVTTSKVVKNTGRAERDISIQQAFCLATLGGAEALRIDERVGRIAVGYDFDALILDAGAGNIHATAEDDAAGLFEKLLHFGHQMNVRSVFVAGRQVVEQEVFINTMFAKL